MAKATRDALPRREREIMNALQTFFGGSLAQMMVSLVRQGSWTGKELEELAAEIQRARKEKSP